MTVGAGDGSGGAGGTGGAAGAAAAGGTGAGSSGAGSAGTSGAGAANSGAGTGVQTDWTSGLQEDFRGFAQNKGWKDASQVVESYRNLEKLVGAPPEQIVRLPKEDDAAGWESVHTRLGRPATPEGYKIEAPKEGGNPEFAKWASSEFHKAGLSEKQGKALSEAWNKFAGDQTAVLAEVSQAKAVAEQGALKKEWGAAYEQNMAQAKRAAREFGISAEAIEILEKTSGYGAVMKHFQAVGSKLGEASFHSGNPGSNANGPLTPAQALDTIKTLRADPGFVKKYTAGDADAQAKMGMLHKYAYPDA